MRSVTDAGRDARRLSLPGCAKVIGVEKISSSNLHGSASGLDAREVLLWLPLGNKWTCGRQVRGCRTAETAPRRPTPRLVPELAVDVHPCREPVR
jgi:hypothetical protein